MLTAPMDGPYSNQPPFNPAFEAWPGGPHPGAIAQMEAERRAAAERRAGEEASEKRRQMLHHLLLLRR